MMAKSIQYLLRTCSIALFSLLTSPLAANTYSDSLKSVWERHSADTIGLKALLELTEFARDSTDLVFFEQGELLAAQLQKGFPALAKRAKAELCINRSYFFYNALDEYDQAIAFMQPCMPPAEAVGDPLLTARALNNLSTYYFAKGDLNTSLSYAEQALALRERSGNQELVAQTLGNIGFLYFKSGQINRSLDYLYRALHLADSLQIPDRQLTALRFLGQVHMAQGDVERARPIAFRLLQLAQVKEDERSMASAYNSIATVFAKLAAPDSALKYFNKALEINERLGNKFGSARVLANIGDIYQAKGQMAKALEYFKKAFDLSELIGHTETMAGTANQIAACYLDLGQTQNAIEWATKAYGLSPASDFPEERKDAAEILAKACEKAGQPAKALGFLKEYIELNTILYNKENTRLLEQKAMGYEYSLREAALIAEESRKQAVLTEQIKGQRRVRNLMILASVLLLLALFAVYNRFKLKQKTARELAEKNQQVEAARQRAEKSEAFRKQFLANMSHEIRTPMNAIIGLSRLMKDTPLNPTARKYTDAIHHSADKLLVVLNDILDLSKLEAGKLKMQAEPFSLEEELEFLEESFMVKAKEKGLHLIVDFPEHTPEWVVGDGGRLVQVLTNLMHNALKFTSQGSVALKVTELGDDRYTFTVSDTGIGIPADKVASIFESFQQAHSGDSRRYGGTGLGLAIASELVQMMGGQLELQSKVGEGSSFFFSLHLPPAQAFGQLQVPSDVSRTYEASQLKLLLAEDNDYNALVTEETLRKFFSGIQVRRVFNGLQVLKAMEEEQFDGLLLDVQMPEMDGYECAQAIRKQGSAIPIVALTASVIRSDIDKCIEAGMDDFVPKPFKEQELIQAILKISKIKLAEVPKASTAKGQTLDALFLKLMPERLQRLQEAIATEDEQAVKSISHLIRPQIIDAGLGVSEETFLSIAEGKDVLVNAKHLETAIEKHIKQLSSQL